jgi:hypothetical protein
VNQIEHAVQAAASNGARPDDWIACMILARQRYSPPTCREAPTFRF